MIRRLTIGNIAYHNKKDEFLYNSLKKKNKKQNPPKAHRGQMLLILLLLGQQSNFHFMHRRILTFIVEFIFFKFQNWFGIDTQYSVSSPYQITLLL